MVFGDLIQVGDVELGGKAFGDDLVEVVVEH